MPYKSKEEARVAARGRMRQWRANKGVTLGVTKVGVTEQGVTRLPPAWQAVKDYITRPTIREPSNLERMQRICGSLGKRADDVWFGFGGLTAQDIGEVIGILPPGVGK